MGQVNPSEAAPYLRDEINFAQGREAFEKDDLEQARAFLLSISKSSRFSAKPTILIATIDTKQKKYREAAAEFSSILEPPGIRSILRVLARRSEPKCRATGGRVVKIMLDVESGLNTSQTLAELAVIGMARISYATKEYEKALTFYDKVSDSSKYYPRISLEKVWSLLNLNRHDDAQKVAGKLSRADTHFESIEAQPLRALILTDHGQTDDAREELARFFKNYETSKNQLNRFIAVRTTTEMPSFLPRDWEEDAQLKVYPKLYQCFGERN